MKITNKYNLPEQFINIAQNDYKYSDDTYSATTLLKGTREILLTRRYFDEIEQDISDMVWLLFGTAVHSMLENKEQGADELKEERITIDVNERKVTGKFDLYNETEKEITDYKTASVWKFIYKDFEDWKKQELIYAWLLKKQGFEVNKGKVVAFLKDHSKSKAQFDGSYPQTPCHTVSFNFNEEDFRDTEEFIYAKINELKECERLTDDVLPICSEKERWAKPTQYAVMEKGKKRAVKLFNNKEDAEILAAERGGYVEERKGSNTKCENYCLVKEFCSFYKNLEV